MMRILHRWPGILAAALIVVVTLSGAALSVFPALESVTAPTTAETTTVADLAGRVQAAHPGLEKIKRTPSGKIKAYWFEQGEPDNGVIDPATGETVASADKNPVRVWITNLHRSFLLDDTGRVAAALTAGAMLILALSGAVLVARRVGGWRCWFAPLKGGTAGRVHVELARVAVVGLTLSALTALWMSAETFGLIEVTPAEPGIAEATSDAEPIPLSQMPALDDIPVSALRSLSPSDPTRPGDTVAIETATGVGVIDPATGEMINWTEATLLQRISETIYMLHTGKGAAVLGVVLGLMALAAPVMAVTGVLMWWAGRIRQPRLRGTVRANQARTVILVGSEGGSTWGFAVTLARALMQAGQSVHLASMSAFAPERYASAERILVLAATYGDGDAPASAKGFLDKLAAVPEPPATPLTVLGFGDRGFATYCGYAQRVSDEAQARGWGQLMPLDTVDRQSSQDFARWGRDLGAVMGIELELVHEPGRPASHALTLVSRRDYGAEVRSPTAILRFALPRTSLWQRLRGRGFGRFAAGDLIGVVPEGATLPRFYSLASSHRDGFLEIVVRKQPGGVCSGQLMALEPGDTVAAFLRRNQTFKSGKGDAPLVLIGAGTGVAPLAGFIRANTRRRPVHLFFGLRHANSDFMYREEFVDWQGKGRLEHLFTAESRADQPQYVQDVLYIEAAHILHAIRHGGQIMVCGGRSMATGVTQALEDILAPAGVTPAMLKAEGRYVEDVY
ncbi:PepSY domain-containing protein [Spiribacter vilamensis]|uniref:NADPH--hemoprotein reductase n=1 Tax=Spiribacter vilamensis TaxID=531306 RepID=A0A4Q8CZN4_9GAMM|nr:PepSY domain-containing protein [Spiribacter vilamensis]RZU98407.1 sulfite reductase (NADPH) flavoprotein alpha-component [Spiribacter vilamensis]TVO60714.1 N-acetylglucosamine transferase [Spiribacter vilamensis]